MGPTVHDRTQCYLFNLNLLRGCATWIWKYEHNPNSGSPCCLHNWSWCRRSPHTHAWRWHNTHMNFLYTSSVRSWGTGAYPSWPWCGFTLDKLTITGLHRNANNHSHSHSLYGQFRVTNSPTLVFCFYGGGKKLGRNHRQGEIIPTPHSPTKCLIIIMTLLPPISIWPKHTHVP